MSEQPNAGYIATAVESKWYQAWEKAGLFQPESGEKPVYSITIPPPNITGSLHMGHALCYPLQDLLGRYKRLKGFRVLILPGQDHAGIATQSVVSKHLKKAGQSASALGRDGFVEKVWEWRAESGDTILRQFRALGCAFDWSRERFTLDDEYAKAVLKVFINWFDRGLIYRGKRVVNWDPILKTSVSDIETERQTLQGKLYHIRYAFADGTGSITIATTRPETLLADAAVAVHPKDARYEGLVGKMLILPLVGREIPLLADEYPDPTFGTGAVKITPGHDPNDFEVGIRHNLPLLLMLDESAKVTELGGVYAGLDRFEARKRIVADLEEHGHLEKIEDHEIAILISDRSKSVIEPLASEQWFVNQRELGDKAIKVVQDGQIEFFPERFKDVYLDWMLNLRDWNISRQLWWGHRIPVYYTQDGTAFAALSWEEAQAKAGDEPIVRQDDDVLDTWFSSGLWPFATMGWPNQTVDLETFYPTNVLVTSREILYLWVARMIMMGLDFVHQIPFRQVYIYATVLTDDGKRMSKSLGTGIDPMEIINTKGADALRYTLFSQTGLNQDLRYSERKTNDARNLCNKIWNASRFVLMNLEGYDYSTRPELEAFDHWLLSRLAACEEAVEAAYEGYDVQSAASALYQFFYSELCDWYIEVTKSRLQDEGKRGAPQYVLLTSLEAFLKMMHPIMPFITEEIYQQLPLSQRSAFLMSSSWPEVPAHWRNMELESQVEFWLDLTRSLRAFRAESGLPAMKQIPVIYYEGDLHGGEAVIRSQAWFTQLKPGQPSGEEFVSSTSGGVDWHLPTAGLIDKTQDLARQTKERAGAQAELDKLEARLNNPQFIERAKPEVVERERATAAELVEKLAKIDERLSALHGSPP